MLQAIESWVGESRCLVHEPTLPSRLTLDIGHGASRVSVVVSALEEHKSQVAVEHERLADPDTAATTKSFWQEKLAGLKAFLED